jgi:hypothetical protein
VTITDEDLSRWEALAKMSTAGPWTVRGPTARSIEGPFGHHVTDTEYCDDAAFIAAARDAVPALCAEVRRLREVIDVSDSKGGEAFDSEIAVVAERDALRAEVDRMQTERAAIQREAYDATVEASELRASLADAVGKIEAMRGQLRRAIHALPAGPFCRDCADHDGTCQSEGKVPCDPYEALPIHIAALRRKP